MNPNHVHNAIVNTLTTKRDHIALISQFSGGWEGWLQCELALCWEPGVVEREVPLWGDRRACDLWFPSSSFCVELKCLGLCRVFKSGSSPKFISDIDTTFVKFAKDVLIDAEKIDALPKGYKGMSAVIVPTWLPIEALQRLKTAMDKYTYRWQEQSGFYIAYRLGGWL